MKYQSQRTKRHHQLHRQVQQIQGGDRCTRRSSTRNDLGAVQLAVAAVAVRLLVMVYKTIARKRLVATGALRDGPRSGTKHWLRRRGSYRSCN